MIRKPFYVQAGASFENPHGMPKHEVGNLILEAIDPGKPAQVIFGKLVPGDGVVFTGELVRNLFLRDQKPIVSARWIDEKVKAERLVKIADGAYRRGFEHRRYFAGVDLARKQDATVVFVIDTLGAPERPARLVYYSCLERVPWPLVYAEVGYVQHLFSADVLCDSTGIGDVVCDEMDGRRYCPVHHIALPANDRCRDHNGVELACIPRTYTPISVDRYHFSASTKVELVTHLQQALGYGYVPGSSKPFGLLRCPPVVRLDEELAFYKWEDKKLSTDHVFALALAAWHGLVDVPPAPVFGSIHGG